MKDTNFNNLMSNIMNETKKRRYTDKQAKLMRKYYGLLSDTKNKTTLKAEEIALKGIEDLSMRDTQSSNYTKKQLELRQKLISDTNGKIDNN